MEKLKIIIIVISILLTSSGCSIEKGDSIEGNNEFETAACRLAKEYVISRGYLYSAFDQIKCIFLEEQSFENGEAIAIYMEPSEIHPNYGEYIEMKDKLGKNPSSNILYVNPDGSGPLKNVIVHKNASPPYLKTFIKEGDNFREPTTAELEQLVEIIE